MPRHRLVRDDPAPPDDAQLVRALFDTHPDHRTFDRDVLIADAHYNFTLFGYYGLSLWLASLSWPLDRVLEEKCRRARRVAMFSARSLRDAGLSLLPSGRAPHYDTTLAPSSRSPKSIQVTAETAEQLVDRFLTAPYTVMENNFHDQGQ